LFDRSHLAKIIGLQDIAVLDSTNPCIVNTERDKSTVHYLEFALDSGETVPAFICAPRNRESRGTIMALHQHNNEYAYGKSEVAGLAGHDHAAYGMALADAGFTVVCPDFPGFEDRRKINDQRDEFLAAMASITMGGTLHGRMLAEILAIANYLHDDNGPIGVVGHSLGGQIALLAGVLSPAIRKVVVSAGVTTLEACFQNDIQHNPGWYIPELQRNGDYPAIASLYTGQQALFVSHEYDDYFPADGAREFFRALPDEGSEHVWLEQGHAMSEKSLKLVVEWFVTSHMADPI